MFRFLAIFLSASSAAAVGESIRRFSNHHHRLSPQTPRCSPNHGAGDSSLCGSRGVRLSSEAPAANAGAAAFPATVKCARQAPSVNRFHHPRPFTTLVGSPRTRNLFQISGLPPAASYLTESLPETRLANPIWTRVCDNGVGSHPHHHICSGACRPDVGSSRPGAKRSEERRV